ncbi:MAG: KTSC domain-containing protein [Phenylobacterium sp.]
MAAAGHPAPVPRVQRTMPSSVIRTFDYDAAARRLDVQFVSGRRYSYFEIPEDLAERMRRSFSKGEFFNAHVRDRFRYARIGSG